MSKTEFDTHKFAGSLPRVIVLPRDYTPLPFGAVCPGLDAGSEILDNRIIFQMVWYATHKNIHGLLHYDGPNQLFFVGYECGSCGGVFLVPDSVRDETDLHEALRHKCTGDGALSEFSLRTRVLHCVQDIGRAGGLGSVGCELWVDRIMELFAEHQQ